MALMIISTARIKGKTFRMAFLLSCFFISLFLILAKELRTDNKLPLNSAKIRFIKMINHLVLRGKEKQSNYAKFIFRLHFRHSPHKFNKNRKSYFRFFNFRMPHLFPFKSHISVIIAILQNRIYSC